MNAIPSFAQSHCGGLSVRIANAPAVLRASGALWLEAQGALVVADLHFEKGSWFAQRGQMLPPYDTAETLNRLEAEVSILSPKMIVCLGDSFHDADGENRLGEAATARIAQLAVGRTLVWIAPPHMPYAPALAAIGIDLERVVIVTTRSPRETLWATEQALRSKACGAVLAWPGAIKYPELRRLQLAAEDNPVLAVLFRAQQAAAETSCAVLRIDLQTYHGQLAVRILKRRGAALNAPILLHSPAVTPGRVIVEHFAMSSRSMPSPPTPLPQRGRGELRAKPLCRAVS